MHDEQCITQRWLNPGHKDKALMGPAHVISGAGAAILFVGLISFFGDQLMQTIFLSSFATVVLFIGVATGGALEPDLDNTSSTVKSSLGFLGGIFTFLFRSSSLLIQSIIKTKKDDQSPDPHRGFWHSTVGAITLGVIAVALSSIQIKITDSDFFLGELTVGNIMLFSFTAFHIHLAITGIAKNKIKKVKDIPIIGDLIVLVFSLVVTGVLLMVAPTESNLWLGVAIAFGCMIHILGDALTVSGVPIFFPLCVINRKKFWWKTRFTKLKANDDKLNSNIKWFSVISTLVGLGFITASFFQ